jgi:hypothetical protein
MNSCLTNYKKILNNGIFYYPAWKHYDKPCANVICDKCLTNNLNACIGYGDSDLCLLCVTILISNNRPNICDNIDIIY